MHCIETSYNILRIYIYIQLEAFQLLAFSLIDACKERKKTNGDSNLKQKVSIYRKKRSKEEETCVVFIFAS